MLKTNDNYQPVVVIRFYFLKKQVGDLRMNLLSFEANKIRNKRLLLALVIAPVLIVLTIFVSRLFTPVDFRSEEVTQANQLLADLSWQIPNYRHMELDPYFEVSEEDQLLIQYIPYTAGAEMHEQLFEIPTLMDFFRIVPLWQWLLMGAGLLLSNLFMINQLVYFVSTFFKNQWVVMASSLVILGLGFVIAIVWPHDIQAFLPFQYLDISQVLSGRVATIHEYSYLTWSTGMIVQTVTGIILLLLSLVKIRRTKHN
ncbi:hypothetical protein [Amphibacillus indicireducens]|uniref:DUF1461 domain-containing protein n=1 Tax=Amphibacillus indicireducens TaxID=1076330 RepID=A0ABP7W2Q2_9BACI